MLNMYIEVFIFHLPLIIRRGIVFWNEDDDNLIYKANLDGSESAVLIRTSISSPCMYELCASV